MEASSTAGSSALHGWRWVDGVAPANSARCRACAVAVVGSTISAVTKGELRERRRMESRQRIRRWEGDDDGDVDDGEGAGNTESRETESVRTGGVV